MKHTATVEVKPVSKRDTSSEAEVCAQQPMPTRIEALLMAGSRPVTEARLGEKLLMGSMHPVEVPDRQHQWTWVAHVFRRGGAIHRQTVHDPHGRRL